MTLDDGKYRCVCGLDLIAAIESNDTEHYFLYDGLGSVTEVADDTGDLATVLMPGAGPLRHRFARASSGFAWALRPVLLWLVLTGLVPVWRCASAMVTGTPARADQVEAARHIFLIGVVTLGIVATGQLMLPEFASERIANPPWQARGPTFGAAVSVAVVLREVLPIAGVESDLRWWLMALAGIVTLLVTSAFALLFWRARRRHDRYPAKLVAMRSGGTTLSVQTRTH